MIVPPPRLASPPGQPFRAGVDGAETAEGEDIQRRRTGAVHLSCERPVHLSFVQAEWRDQIQVGHIYAVE